MRETQYLALLLEWFGPQAVSWVMFRGYDRYRELLAAGRADDILVGYLRDNGAEHRVDEYLSKLKKTPWMAETKKSKSRTTKGLNTKVLKTIRTRVKKK